jgi:hypothetical protein
LESDAVGFREQGEGTNQAFPVIVPKLLEQAVHPESIANFEHQMERYSM